MKLKHSLLLACAAAWVSAPASAELASAPESATVQESSPSDAAPLETADAPTMVSTADLSAGTEVVLSLNEQLSSRTHDDGDTFGMSVVQDVVHEGRVVIPRGTRAVGQVTWQTGTGAFGKSGKMEIAFRYLDLNGQRIPLDGMHRQEGEGNTAATIGAVLGAGVVGGLLVRGRRALIQQGREFTARTVDAIPLDLVGGRALVSARYTPSTVSTRLGQYRPDREESGDRNRRGASARRGS